MNEYTIELRDAFDGHRATLWRQAFNRRQLLAQLRAELTFENRALLSFEWLAKTRIEAVVAPETLNPLEIPNVEPYTTLGV